MYFFLIFNIYTNNYFETTDFVYRSYGETVTISVGLNLRKQTCIFLVGVSVVRFSYDYGKQTGRSIYQTGKTKSITEMSHAMIVIIISY